MSTFDSISPQPYSPRIDAGLLDAIRNGNCVAFVGAGFSAAANFPQWQELIRRLTDKLPAEYSHEKTRELIRSLLRSQAAPSNRDLEMAAQLLFDALTEETFCRYLQQVFSEEKPPVAMQRRLRHLRGIPFRAIVTTNFDPLLPGTLPSAEAYRRLLRPRRRLSPWREAITRIALGDEGLNGFSSDTDALIVQLHGQLEHSGSLVLTRSQYRHRLYGNPAYLTMLRSLLASSTVLFLGYSMTDAYLNELRSELVEAFSDQSETAEPMAWAIIEGVTEIAQSYYRQQEGLGVIPYRASADGTNHDEFDAILKAIYDQTNPVHRLGEQLKGCRILWLDTHPDNNDLGRKLLQAALKDCGDGTADCDDQFVPTAEIETALTHLTQDGSFDLVISHWGYGEYQGRPNGAELLRRMARSRSDGTPLPPVVIFASGDYEAENRRLALSLGAAEYVSRWEDLIELVSRLLAERFNADSSIDEMSC